MEALSRAHAADVYSRLIFAEMYESAAVSHGSYNYVKIS
jgi:hypothetical protein